MSAHLNPALVEKAARALNLEGWTYEGVHEPGEYDECADCRAVVAGPARAMLSAVADDLRAEGAHRIEKVRAVHAPREERVIEGDCAEEECDHEGGCPTVPLRVCAECWRIGEESDRYFGERGVWHVAYPCPTIRALDGEAGGDPMTPRVWVERPIISVEDAEALPIGAILTRAGFMPTEKWQDDEGTTHYGLFEIGLLPDDFFGWTALVPVEATEDALSEVMALATLGRAQNVRRLVTPWEDV